MFIVRTNPDTLCGQNTENLNTTWHNILPLSSKVDRYFDLVFTGLKKTKNLLDHMLKMIRFLNITPFTWQSAAAVVSVAGAPRRTPPSSTPTPSLCLELLARVRAEQSPSRRHFTQIISCFIKGWGNYIAFPASDLQIWISKLIRPDIFFLAESAERSVTPIAIAANSIRLAVWSQRP
jgi:hypothetical protein